MLRTELLAELRVIIDDTLPPYGWSDIRLMNFLALGQTQFCKDTGFFRDPTSYSIVTVAGQAAYTLQPQIIKVLSVWDGDVQLAKGQLQGATPAKPIMFALDLAAQSITLSPTPDAIYTFPMRVWRSALQRLDHKTGNAYATEMEIHEDFHLAPVEWAATKCFGDHDRERQDPVKAADHLENYKALAREGKRAFGRICGESADYAPSSLYLV